MKKMKSGLDIFKLFEELAFKEPGVTQIGHIIYDDLGNINNIKYYNIEESSLRSILKEKQPGVGQIDRGKNMVILKVITKVIKSKKSSCEIELPFPDLKGLTVKQEVALENCFAEAERVIIERKEEGKDREVPIAPTKRLEVTYDEVLRHNASGSKEFKHLEEIFAL